MERPRIGVVGASGYSGAVAARLIAAHPSFSLAFVTSDKLAGTPAKDRLGAPIADALSFVPNTQALDLAAECDAVLLATPAEASAALVPELHSANPSLKIVDLSGAFRLGDAAAYPLHYGFEHHSPEALAGAWYGLPELFGPPPRSAYLVANPGCYPTAALLALAPLLRAGLVDPLGIIIDAKSGVSGAGVQSRPEYSFVEVAEDVRAYKLFTHQHTPEISRHLGRAAGHDAGLPLVFTPHLVPVRRGLIATCYARARPDASTERVHSCLADVYASSPFVDVVAPGDVTMKSVAGTNRARVAAASNGDLVVAIGAIDNLVKGAAGQAIQNLNLWLERGETEGLDHLHPMAP